MSADNWAICPKCEYDKSNNENQLKELYGKIPLEEYLKLINETKDKKLEYTFREDYEIGIYHGKFYVDYSGYCEVCEFEYKYKYEDKNLTLRKG